MGEKLKVSTKKHKIANSLQMCSVTRQPKWAECPGQGHPSLFHALIQAPTTSDPTEPEDACFCSSVPQMRFASITHALGGLVNVTVL